MDRLECGGRLRLEVADGGRADGQAEQVAENLTHGPLPEPVPAGQEGTRGLGPGAVPADRIGRRRVLLIGALLMLLAAGVFAVSDLFIVLAIAATIGVIMLAISFVMLLMLNLLQAWSARR